MEMNTSRIEVECTLSTLGLPAVRGEEDHVQRVLHAPFPLNTIRELQGIVQFIGVTEEFKAVIDYFKTPAGETPAGFRIGYCLDADHVLRADLVRDISYDRNGRKRPTRILFSADSANPYEVAPCANLLANLTCNPGIIYDLFINNPKANIGNAFKNRDEVMTELGKILGPGCDISVELNNPFEKDTGKLLEEAAKFREILSRWRVVIKVPHTGPVNSDNVGELLAGDRRFSSRWDEPSTTDAFRGHQLALMMHDHGYRTNFTLMFEPHQTMLALQARPYFINSFVRHRMSQSQMIQGYLDAYRIDENIGHLKLLRSFLVDKDYLAKSDTDHDLLACKAMGENIMRYRRFSDPEGMDGFDSVRHNLRCLRQANLPDTRLIICSMEGERNYPELDKALMESEFADLTDRVVITAEPSYLARFTSANQVISYQRRFMNAANGMN